MNKNDVLADLLFPDVDLLPENMFHRFPLRNLNASTRVTRIAPSPTGFLTIGGLYATFISERFAHQTDNGIFYLRIEDTDKKREVNGSIGDILHSLDYIGIRTDEGVSGNDTEIGQYGPYKQSSRGSIYKVFIKSLLVQGLAYPCFCNENQLQSIRTTQQLSKTTTGYYGKWAVHRNCSLEEIKQELAQGKPYVIRLKSLGSADVRIEYKDLIKGVINMPENDQDIVIMKSDGIPTYHFAHVVDDLLMGTTHVIRGDEWISSVPIHLQLFQYLGYNHLEYGHLAPIMKMEGSSKRKFSKRKDPDAAVQYYQEQGYPGPVILEYFMTLIDPNFEAWRRSHPMEPFSSFEIDLFNMNKNGPLFDFHKLNDIGKNMIEEWTAEDVYSDVCDWAKIYDIELYDQLVLDAKYSVRIFNIGRNSDKPRKDIAKWSDVRPTIDFFFDEFYDNTIRNRGNSLLLTLTLDVEVQLVKRYCKVYSSEDSRDAWFAKIKELSIEQGFAADIKTFKKNPGQYKGHIGDVTMVLRMALTCKTQTPDLFDIMQVMGEHRVHSRFKKFAETHIL